MKIPYTVSVIQEKHEYYTWCNMRREHNYSSAGYFTIALSTDWFCNICKKIEALIYIKYFLSSMLHRAQLVSFLISSYLYSHWYDNTHHRFRVLEFHLHQLRQPRMLCCHCLPPGSLHVLGHLGHFHRAVYKLKWYKIVCIRYLACTFSQMKSINMFFFHVSAIWSSQTFPLDIYCGLNIEPHYFHVSVCQY